MLPDVKLHVLSWMPPAEVPTLLAVDAVAAEAAAVAIVMRIVNDVRRHSWTHVAGVCAAVTSPHEEWAEVAVQCFGGRRCDLPVQLLQSTGALEASDGLAALLRDAMPAAADGEVCVAVAPAQAAVMHWFLHVVLGVPPVTALGGTCCTVVPLPAVAGAHEAPSRRLRFVSVTPTLDTRAIAAGHVPCLRVIQHFTSQPSSNEDVASAISAAVEGEHEGMLRHLGHLVNLSDRWGRTPLFTAFERALESMVRLLVHLGADVTHAASCDGGTISFSAVNSGRAEMIRLVREVGGDLHAVNRSGWSCLFSAVCQGHEQVVRALVAAGLDIREGSHGTPYLHHTIARGHQRMIPVLHELGIDVNCRDFSGQSAMRWSLRLGQNHMLSTLHSLGADLNEVDSAGRTLLFEACICPHPYCLDELAKLGVDVDAVDACGNTPVLEVVKRGFKTHVERLRVLGARFDVVDSLGRTPFRVAFDEKHLWMMQWLHDNHVAYIDVVDARGFAPLHVASEAGDEMMVRLLIKLGADINAADGQGRTPTMIASLAGRATAVRLLRRLGADTSIPDRDGLTPLAAATAMGNSALITLLRQPLKRPQPTQ